MNSFYKASLLILIIAFTYSCAKTNKQDISKYQSISDSIKKSYAPDKRVAIYDINLNSNQNKIILKGESDQPKAVEVLKSEIIASGVQIIDSINILPDASVGDTKYAVVNNSVANIRSQNRHSGELATQAILGTGVKVLKIAGDFYLIQTPDAYISWVDHGGVTLMNSEIYLNWTNAPKVIYTNTSGYTYQENNIKSSRLSDIVLGAQLKFLAEDANFYQVEYPDKRIGFIKKTESELFSKWITNVKPNGDLVETYAREFLGAPYLWGGTSTKGMDCSGFTKTVYLMNGFIIPRDASQQINAGLNVDPELKFENLKKGDLMFFGKKATDSTKQRTTHVGIWLGNGKGDFIHEASQVRLSSIKPGSEYYDKHNTNRYLGSRRYLGVKDKMITDLKTDKILTEIKQ